MVLTVNQALPDYRQIVELLDGRQIIIRSICPDDRLLLMAFFCRLSDETRFLRYHYSKSQLTESELNEQKKGIGTQLLKHLSILAWQRDIHYFFGEVLRNKAKMLSIFRKSDPDMKQVIDSGSTCVITLSVAEAIRRAPKFKDDINPK
jgi:hypothetical protein